MPLQSSLMILSYYPFLFWVKIRITEHIIFSTLLFQIYTNNFDYLHYNNGL